MPIDVNYIYINLPWELVLSELVLLLFYIVRGWWLKSIFFCFIFICLYIKRDIFFLLNPTLSIHFSNHLSYLLRLYTPINMSVI